MDHEIHRRALSAASRLVVQLPAGTVWSVSATNEDTTGAPGAFNVFVNTMGERLRIRNMLGFGKPYEESKSHESHKFQDTLLVSIIQPEEGEF